MHGACSARLQGARAAARGKAGRRTGQLAHDLGTVDEEEEGARLVRHRARDERLACQPKNRHIIIKCPEYDARLACARLRRGEQQPGARRPGGERLGMAAQRAGLLLSHRALARTLGSPSSLPVTSLNMGVCASVSHRKHVAASGNMLDTTSTVLAAGHPAPKSHANRCAARPTHERNSAGRAPEPGGP